MKSMPDTVRLEQAAPKGPTGEFLALFHIPKSGDPGAEREPRRARAGRPFAVCLK